MHTGKQSVLVLCLLMSSSGFGTVASNWRLVLKNRLSEFLSCKDQIDDASPCNRFVGRAVADVYGIQDFIDPSEKGQYIPANLIDTYVVTSKDWVDLGSADKQSDLNEATKAANDGYATIAVRSGERHGHVALILPGTATPSPKWGLRVPNSACFFLGQPAQSYVGDKLSMAFQSPKGVRLFARETARTGSQ